MDKKKYFEELIGKERAEQLFKETEGAQADLQAAGVTSKETKETPPETPATPPPAVPGTPDLQTVLDHVMKELDIEGLETFVSDAKVAMEKVPMLEELVKQLSAKKDEELAEMISPRHSWSVTKARASQAEASKINDEDPLLKKKPESESWLSEATGTKPVPIQ